MFGFLSLADLATSITANIDKVPVDIDLVVGVPRSGMIPAYTIGLFRNLPVLDLPSFLMNCVPGTGFRRLEIDSKSAHTAKWILLVDDSITSGRAMRQAVEKVRESGFKGMITTCAIIAEPSRGLEVDIFFREMPQPRLFEWNAFHHDLVESACFDLDGVLCVDPTEHDNDDGPRYREFLRRARPRFRPTRIIAHIVSARLEKYRELTQDWLADNKIAYGQLHLIDLPNAAERRRLKAHCSHKAKVYLDTNASIFFESDATQARDIARLSSKAVLCTDEMRVYLPGFQVKSASQLARWRFATPVGRLKARLRAARAHINL